MAFRRRLTAGVIVPVRSPQSLDQGVDLLFEMRQGLVGLGTIEVVNMPILDAVFPERELLGHHGAVLRFLDGDHEIGLGQVGEREGLRSRGWSSSGMPRCCRASTV